MHPRGIFQVFQSRAVLLLACLVPFAALAQSATPPPTPSLTVDQIFGDRGILPTPPTDFYWSPNGATVAWIVPDSQPAPDTPADAAHNSAEPGDLVALDTNTGKLRVLAAHNRLAVLDNASLSEVDLDHRLRYDMPSILWSPDAKSLLLDPGGKLYLYDIAHGVARPLTSAQPSADDPKFSPDGKFITYIRNHGLYLRSIAPHTSPRELPIAASPDPTILNGEADWVYLEELNVRGNYFWSPDSTRIAYLQMNESRVPTYPITDWLPDSSANSDHAPRSHTDVNLERYPQPGDPNPDVRLGITSIDDPTHSTKWLTLPISPGNDYIPRFGWLDKKTLWIEVLDRAQQHLHLYFADAETNAPTNAIAEVYTETDAKFLDINYDFTFLPHGQFLRTSWRDGHTHLYLYSYDENSPLAAPATLVRQLTTGNFDVDAVLGVSPDGARAYFTSNQLNPLGREFFSVSLTTGLITRLSFDQYTVGPESVANGNHEISLSPATTAFIDSESTAAWPGKVSLVYVPPVVQKHSLTLDPAKRLFNSLSALATSTSFVFWQSAYQLPNPPIRITLKAADGTTPLYGWLTLPASTKHASVPLVLNPYGGPGEQSVRDTWGGEDALFNQLLAQHGIAVLNVDNRGMSMRGRDFAQAAFHNFGPVQFSDQLAALDQVLARYPQLDPHRLGFWGWSFGGTFTLYALSHSDRFRTGIAVAPVTDWRLYDSIFTERYLGQPATNVDAYNTASLLSAADNLHGHLLLVHGTGDDNVHLANTIQYIQALITANKKYDLQLFPRKTHSLLGDQPQVELYTRILNQLETDLK